MHKAIEILLVEDNPADVELTEATLRLAKIRNRLHVVRDGVEAMQFLRRNGDFADAIRPDVILLDLHLPRKNGRQVLSELKQDPDLSSIPIAVLSSSDVERDLGAHCYLSKPIDLNQFTDMVKSIEDFWFVVIKLPPGSTA